MIHVEQTGAYTGHRGSIFAMVVDPDERYAYSSGDDGVVARWDLRGVPDLGDGLLQVGHAIYALALMPEHGLLAAGGSEGSLYFLDLARREVLHTYRKTEGAIYGLHYEAERQLLWILHAQGALSVVKVPSFEERGYARIAQENLRSIALSLDGTHYFLGSSDQHIYVFDRKKAEVVHRWQAHDSSVFALQLHPGGKFLISGGRDAYLNVWDLQQAGYPAAHRLPAHRFTVNDLALSPEQDYFISASRDKTLKLWSAYQLELLKVIDWQRYEGHKHSVNRVIWLSEDNSVLSCSDDRRILRWRIKVER